MNLQYEKSLCFTGHRPNKLSGYDYRSEGNLKMLKKLRALIVRFIEKRGITTFITGMALGIDIWSAKIILALKHQYPHIKLVCAIPCKAQWSKWSDDDKDVWQDIVSQADYVEHVSRETYTDWCMQKRNEWMVDNSSYVIAVWDGIEDGGTWNCIKYAKKRQRKIVQLHPKTLEISL